MKKIYLIRHAKSNDKNNIENDFERGLSKRGKEDIKFMAKRLKFFEIMPDIIISSPAKRARKTAEGIASIVEYKNEIVYEPSLYESTPKHYMDLITNLDDSIHSVFMIAHNPTITEIGEYLSGAILTNIPTCSIVCIAFDVNTFKKIQESSGSVLFFDYPKKHRK
ncbi:SixA phosphatase family protein [Sulfurospirillum sp. 1612]|uniref:SixA phosphatase family protein n=1 Tax=Sulfurospirillum sp. 1612 TaxID=3094835 RepID=UPI002F92D429